MKKIAARILALVMVMSLCACGKQPCQEHSWGNWEEVEESTYFTPGKSMRRCQSCDAVEYKDDLQMMFLNYAEILLWLPFFTDAQLLQQDLYSVLSAAFFGHANYTTQQGEDGLYYHTMKVSDLHAFTKKVFGCTYDYTGISDMWVLFESKANYDPQLDAVVICAAGAGEEMPLLTGVEHTVTEGGVYVVTAYYELGQNLLEKVFCVDQRDGNYVISSY